MKKRIVFACLLGSFTQVSALTLINQTEQTYQFWMLIPAVETENQNRNSSDIDPKPLIWNMRPGSEFKLDNFPANTIFSLNAQKNKLSLIFEKSFIFDNFDPNGTYYIMQRFGIPAPFDVVPTGARIKEASDGLHRCSEEPTQYFPVLQPMERE